MNSSNNAVASDRVVIPMPNRFVKSAEPVKFSPRLDGVLTIQDGFGLPMGDLAAILHVPRGYFTAWIMRGDLTAKAPPSDTDDLVLDRRIERLSFWAVWWRKNSDVSLLRVSRRTLSCGRSLIDLLCAPALDDGMLAQGFAEVLAADDAA